MSAPPLRWGLIGGSKMALEYVGPAILAAGHTIAAVASASRERAEQLAAAHGAGAVHTAYEELLASGEVDAVYVSSTNEQHAPQAIAAARAGVHVLCEKPLAMSADEARAMIHAAREASVVLATNHHLRQVPTHRTVRALIADGVLGQPLAVRVMHASFIAPEWRGWRLETPAAGAGVVYDLTVHDADLLRFLLGDEVEQVTALASPPLLAVEGVEDAVMSVLRFVGGTLAFCHDAFTTPNAENKIEIYGSEGALQIAGGMYGHGGCEAWLVRGEQRELVARREAPNLYESVARELAAAVAGDGAPSSSGEDGLRSLQVAEAVRESLRAGRAVDLTPTVEQV
jgi:1,5-anhydro-D-fructose reductase (1,5-anhydro-D-mannitol-forming)